MFERALALAPTDGAVLLGRAAAQLADGRIEDAIAGLAGQLAQHPGWLLGHATLCRLRWLAGERARLHRELRGGGRGGAARDRDLARMGRHADARRPLRRRAGGGRRRPRRGRRPHPVFDALETVAVAEKGEIDAADALFAALGPIAHVTMAARYLRHLLRAGRPAEAATFAEPWLGDPEADLVWPYVATAWRLTGDPRWAVAGGR